MKFRVDVKSYLNEEIGGKKYNIVKVTNYKNGQILDIENVENAKEKDNVTRDFANILIENGYILNKGILESKDLEVVDFKDYEDLTIGELEEALKEVNIETDGSESTCVKMTVGEAVLGVIIEDGIMRHFGVEKNNQVLLNNLAEVMTEIMIDLAKKEYGVKEVRVAVLSPYEIETYKKLGFNEIEYLNEGMDCPEKGLMYKYL